MKRTLLVCCAGHFCVDFACALLLFRSLRGEAAWAELLLLYNFCAFALQMPLGLLADRWNRDGLTAACGPLLIAGAYLCSGQPWLAAAAAGVGNAAFHVGAGLETLSLAEERAGPLGLFVAPGAVGLFCGTLLGRGGGMMLWPGFVLLLCTSFALFRAKTKRPDALPVPELLPLKEAGVPLGLLLAVVVFRSCVGMTLTFSWKEGNPWALALTLALALGKAAGGYLADRFGFPKTAAVSLALAALLFLLWGENPICGTAAVLLFNMTMPLTLWAAARLLPGAKGFAFGLLTFGLFLGFLPAAWGAPALSPAAAVLPVLLSLVLLLPGLGKAVER